MTRVHLAKPISIAMVSTLLAGSLGCPSLDELAGSDESAPPLAHVAVLSTSHRACALSNGALYCWGKGTSALDDVLNGDSLAGIYTARRVAEGRSFTAIAMGNDFTCGVSDGTILCWGENDEGQLGDGSLRPHADPQPIASSARYKDVAAGLGFACGLSEDARVFCWGGNGATYPVGPETRGRFVTTASGAGAYAQPVDTELTGVDRIFVGPTALCALRGDQLFCWGYAEVGSLANSDVTVAAEAVAMPGSWKSVALGQNHLCAISTAGELHCQGQDSWGMLGLGVDTLRRCEGVLGCAAGLLRVPGRSDWSSVAVGDGHTCGLAGEQLFCWGSNDSGQVGLESRSSTPCYADAPDIACAAEPQPLGKPGTWSSLALGPAYTCGLQDGKVYCWGAFEDERAVRPYHRKPRNVVVEK